MFKITHANIVDPYILDELLPCFIEQEREFVAKYILQGDESYTLWLGNKVVGVMGCTPILDGVMYGWSLLSKDILQCRIAFAKTMRDLIKRKFEQGTHRFFTYVDADNHMAIRQNEWMGLEFEGLLRQNGFNRKNQVIMAKVVG